MPTRHGEILLISNVPRTQTWDLDSVFHPPTTPATCAGLQGRNLEQVSSGFSVKQDLATGLCISVCIILVGRDFSGESKESILSTEVCGSGSWTQCC